MTIAVLLIAQAAWAEKHPLTATAVTRSIRSAGQSAFPSVSQRLARFALYLGGRLADGFRDVRASQVYDLVTIVVSDNSSAVSTGRTNTNSQVQRQGVGYFTAGPKSATGALANLANASNNTQLQGQGTTSRGTTLSTTVTAEVS